MADINTAYDKIVTGFEGLYSDDKNDRGGETVYGIARNSNPNWEGWQTVDALKRSEGFPKNLIYSDLNQLAVKFYKKRYWDVLRLDEFKDQKIATELFDLAINMGARTSIFMLQRALNVLNRNQSDYKDVDVDGIIGDATINAANTQIVKSSTNLLLTLNALQGAKYIEICEANKKQEVFFNGWIKRVSFCY